MGPWLAGWLFQAPAAPLPDPSPRLSRAPVNEADGIVAEQEDEELPVEQFVNAASPAQQEAGEGA